MSNTRDWRRITAIVALAAALLDAALLQRRSGFFTGGFLSATHLPNVAESSLFVFGLTVLNSAIAAPLCLIALAGARRVGLRSPAAYFAVFLGGFMPFAAADFVSYRLWEYLGDALNGGVLFTLVGGRASEALAVGAPLLGRPVFFVCVLLTIVMAATYILHRTQQFRGRPLLVPAVRTALGVCWKRFVFAGAVVVTSAAWPASFDYGLWRTPAGQLLGRMLNAASDFDFDGAGLLRVPRDSAPFNPSIHPYAAEIAGNGIDENGLGGDLPLARVPHLDSPGAPASWKFRPPVVLFVLESFRADVLGTTFRGRRVTSVLDALARNGLSVDDAWSHNGFTSQSRFHILSGSFSADASATTLLDDFKRQGYEVAYFSAQDDSFGDFAAPAKAVDHYYDARQDLNRRYSTYTTPGSLAVPANVLEDRIERFLRTRRSAAPLLLYVNFHDTHYPYHYQQLPNLLGVEPLPAAMIHRRNQHQLRATYLNAVANVDRAIGRVLQHVRTAVGEFPAAVVIGDHGESLFEEGFLGHGYALNESQTRIPLIISGLPVVVPTPFGQVGLRQTLDAALSGRNGAPERARPVARKVSRASVFQYLGRLDHPSQIARLTTTGKIVYDFRTDRVKTERTWKRRADLTPAEAAEFSDLVYTWEATRAAPSSAASWRSH